MKQIIVMTAMVILGIAIATMVLSFRSPAEKISSNAITNIEKHVMADGQLKG